MFEVNYEKYNICTVLGDVQVFREDFRVDCRRPTDASVW